MEPQFFCNGVKRNIKISFNFSRVSAIIPKGVNDPSAMKNKQMANLVQYAQKVEDDMYSTAASKVMIFGCLF